MDNQSYVWNILTNHYKNFNLNTNNIHQQYNLIYNSIINNPKYPTVNDKNQAIVSLMDIEIKKTFNQSSSYQQYQKPTNNPNYQNQPTLKQMGIQREYEQQQKDFESYIPKPPENKNFASKDEQPKDNVNLLFEQQQKERQKELELDNQKRLLFENKKIDNAQFNAQFKQSPQDIGDNFLSKIKDDSQILGRLDQLEKKIDNIIKLLS